MSAAIHRDDERDVALVGIGCRFPGYIADVANFWEFLCEGRDAIGEIPGDRMDVAAFFDPEAAAAGKLAVNRGGYLERIDELDASFFGISPREADLIDPQQRLLLETAWEALEDAGQDAAGLANTRTGVFVGQWTSDFEGRLFAHPEAMDFYAVQGSGRYASSGRISYVLGLRGPSLTLDTACSSSLVAVHLATRSIRYGECDIALAGAANIILQPHISISYSQARMLALDGHCKFGDAAGDGYVRSEGAAVVLLKSLTRAIADGDRIYAVIRGSAVNNDGSASGSMGRPSQTAQEEVLRLAYEDAGVPVCRVAYLEAHGTGTRAGDPVELRAIAAVLGGSRPVGNPLFVGSVKTNLGHTEAAAGMAGLIKAALVLHHRCIPPSLHHSSPNPSLGPAERALIIPSKLAPLPRDDGPAVVGVTAFGISGTNAHVVLEERCPTSAELREDPFAQWAPAVCLPLSARSPQALRRLAALMAERIEQSSPSAIGDICWTAARRRTALSHRVAFAAETCDALVERLREFSQNDEARAAAGRAAPKVCFVCPGQGGQWLGMARELMAHHPSFRAALEDCDRAASAHLDVSIVAQLTSDPGQAGYRLDDIGVIQPVLVALAIAYSRLLGEFAIVPSAVVGHSMGEVAAAEIAGVIDVDRAMEIACRRSALMRPASGQGAMAVVELSMSEAAKRLAGRESKVNVAANNSPRSSVISGDAETVRQVMAELAANNVFCRLVKVDVASHSPQMERPAAALASELAGMSTSDERILIWSTVLARRASGDEFTATYWGRNLREPVLFADTLNGLLDADISVFVELGPHPVLLHAVEQTARAKDAEATTIACGRREEGDSAALLSALGNLWAAGYPVEWARILPGNGRTVTLPLYPWQREKHWASIANRVSASTLEAPATWRDEEALDWLYALSWRANDPPRLRSATPVGRFLVIGQDGPVRSALKHAMAAAGVGTGLAEYDQLGRAVDAAALGAGGLAGIFLLLPEGPETPYLPVRVLRALLKPGWRTPPRLWILSQGAQAVDPQGKERISIDQAAAWGAGRVIGEEHPDLWGGLIDLDPKANATEEATLIVQHVLSADGEDQIAFRSGRRFVARLTRKALAESTLGFQARPDAAYLITGGLGEIGLHLAGALAESGARRLILLGRSELPPRELWLKIDPYSAVGRRISAVRALEAQGIAINLAEVDVSDETALQTFLERYNAEGWPLICGVIHAAGTLDDCLAHSMNQERFDALLGAKLRGAQHLDRLLPQLEFLVLTSSTASLLIQPGQVGYAAANAGLDALAHDRRARGLPSVSIGWGVWEDTGLMKGREGALKLVEMRRQGIGAIPPTKGAALFRLVCQSAEPNVAVAPIDWATFQQALAARRRPMFADNTAAVSGENIEGRRGKAQTNSIRGSDDLDQTVRKAVGAVLKIPLSRLDSRKPLGEMGLTSLMAIELRNLLETALRRPLSATLAWNYPTIEALIEFLGGDASKAAAVWEADGNSFATFRVELAAEADLTDENALAALRKVSRTE